MAASDVQQVPSTSSATPTTFYPAFCFKVSPTHFAWVKMTAAEMRRLKPRKGFEGKLCFSFDVFISLFSFIQNQ
jgi:hypothetical protein